MRRIHIILLALFATLSLCAQDNNQQQQRFSPEAFDAAMQEYITREAGLNAQEAAKIFPVYKEMMAKQRAVFEKQRKMVRVKPQDEAGCLKAIKERDDYDLELKRIQQTYHNKFLELLSASKVYDILKAEDDFHRSFMRNWGRNQRHSRHGQQPFQQPFQR